MRSFAYSIVVAASLCGAEADACSTDVYSTRVVGWDASTRAFVVERLRAETCASCTCAVQSKELRVLGARSNKPTAIVSSYDDGCGVSFDLLEDVADADKWTRSAWPRVKAIADRAAAAGTDERARALSYTPASKKSKSAGTLAVVVEVPAGARERVIRVERAASNGAAPTTLASVRWTPRCSEAGCDQVSAVWAPDGSAVAVVAGAARAEAEGVADHGPQGQPADVLVIDLASAPARVQRDELRVTPSHAKR